MLRLHSCREQTIEQSKESKGLCLLNSSFSWRETWDSLRHVTGKWFLLGPGRLLRGRCAPSGWLSRRTHCAVTTSTSAILRELWATHLLTHQVCSRDQIGGKWWWSWTRVYVAFEKMWHTEERWWCSTPYSISGEAVQSLDNDDTGQFVVTLKGMLRKSYNSLIMSNLVLLKKEQ